MTEIRAVVVANNPVEELTRADLRRLVGRAWGVADAQAVERARVQDVLGRACAQLDALGAFGLADKLREEGDLP